MKTEITLHRPGQIGGCITEIFTGKTRILIDYGEELPGGPKDKAGGAKDKAKAKGKGFPFPWEDRKVDAVLFTHYHGDHIGRFAEIPDGIPLYMSELAREVLVNIHTALQAAAERKVQREEGKRARGSSGPDPRRAGGGPQQEESETAREWLDREKRILRILNDPARVRCFDPAKGQPIRIQSRRQGSAEAPGAASAPGSGDAGAEDAGILVTPCRVDHSAADACMFLIETPDKQRILHTGDFRGHGFGAQAEGRAVLRDVERFAKEKINTLIIEGTMMSRLDEEPWSEAKLRGAADKLFARQRHVFLIVSSTNLDSIRTFYEAAAAKGIPFYCGSDYIASQLNTLGRYAGVPGLAKAGTADPQSAEWRAEVQEKGGFVIIIKGSTRSSGWLVNAMRGYQPAVVYSMWMGYLTRGLDPDLCGFMQFCRSRKLEVIPPLASGPVMPPDGSRSAARLRLGSDWPPMHTSGHASPQLLAQVIQTADPGEILPIHTEDAGGFFRLVPDGMQDRIHLGGYRREEDHRALDETALEKFLPGKPFHRFVQLVKKHSELAFCFRGNSGGEAVIYYKNHAVFRISSRGNVSFDFGHACGLDPEKQQLAQQTLAGFGYSFESRRKAQTEQNPKPAKIISMPPEKAVGLSMGGLEWLTGCIKCMIDAFSEKKKLVEKEIQQTIFLACKARKGGCFFYDMEFTQPWGKLLGCKNKPDLMAVRFGPDGEPERLAFVEVKSTPKALKGGSGLAEHIRGMENYPDWLLPVRGLDACRILEQYIALGLAEGPAGRYEAQQKRFKTLGMEVLLVFTGPDTAGEDTAGEDTLAELDNMIKADPTLLQGYALVTEEFGPLAAALKQREKPVKLRVYRKEL